MTSSSSLSPRNPPAYPRTRLLQSKLPGAEGYQPAAMPSYPRPTTHSITVDSFLAPISVKACHNGFFANGIGIVPRPPATFPQWFPVHARLVPTLRTSTSPKRDLQRGKRMARARSRAGSSAAAPRGLPIQGSTPPRQPVPDTPWPLRVLPICSLLLEGLGLLAKELLNYANLFPRPFLDSLLVVLGVVFSRIGS